MVVNFKRQRHNYIIMTFLEGFDLTGGTKCFTTDAAGGGSGRRPPAVLGGSAPDRGAGSEVHGPMRWRD